MRFLAFFGLLGLVLWLGGCGERREVNLNNELDQRVFNLGSKLEVETSARFRVKRVSVFRDDLAYGRQRGVYVIYDSITGRELVGISGVGIGELGQHQDGKGVRRDER